MAQQIQQGDIFGRLGQSLGKGLARSIPKEIERGRLAEGLSQLEGENNLNPQQHFNRMLALPGMADRPGIMQSASKLARQQAYLNSLNNQYDQGGPSFLNESNRSMNQIPRMLEGDFNEQMPPMQNEKLGSPTLSSPSASQQSWRTYVPPTLEEELRLANENLQKNPERYGYKLENSLSEVQKATQREDLRQTRLKENDELARKREDELKKGLDSEIKKLGITSVPGVVLQNYEDKILNAMLPKRLGGEGSSQQQAINKYSKDLLQADRNYKELDSLSSWSPREFNKRVNSLQQDFAKRGEQRELMDKLISSYKISPSFAAHKAYPLNKNQKNFLNKLPFSHFDNPQLLNNAIYSELMKEMGDEGSPLSIAYQLSKKGYDTSGWMDYLRKNKSNLKTWQGDQVNKGTTTATFNDLWLSAWDQDNKGDD